MPSRLAPHKRLGAQADGEARLQMCRIAFEHEPRVRVSDFELTQDGVSYSYLTCRALRNATPMPSVISSSGRTCSKISSLGNSPKIF